MTRIVCTGYGLKAAGASNVQEFRSLLVKGKSALELTEDYARIPLWLGVVKDTLPELEKRHKKYPRHTQLALASAIQALAQANFDDSCRLGVFTGTTSGSAFSLFDAQGIARINPASISFLDSLYYVSHMTTSALISLFKRQVLSRTVSTGCSAALDALQDALLYLRSGVLDVALITGVDELLVPPSIRMFMGSIEDGQVTCYGSPFDTRSQGVALGEGAGALVVETLEHALSRGATPLGEIVSLTSNSFNIHPFLRSSDPTPMFVAGLEAFVGRPLTYLNSQAMGDPQADLLETALIQTLLPASLPVTSIKGYIGSQFGASGVMQIIASLLSVEGGFIPPLAFSEGFGSSLNLVLKPKFTSVDAVGLTSHGFGGTNVCAVIGKVP